MGIGMENELNDIKHMLNTLRQEIEKINVKTLDNVVERIRELEIDLGRIINILVGSKVEVGIERITDRQFVLTTRMNRLISLDLVVDNTTTIEQLFNMLKDKVIQKHTSIIRNTIVDLIAILEEVKQELIKAKDLKDKIDYLEQRINDLSQ